MSTYESRKMKQCFCERLRELRLARKMSQSELADALGLSRSAVGMYEQGHREPDFEVLGKIVAFSGVSFDWLLGYEEIVF